MMRLLLVATALGITGLAAGQSGTSQAPVFRSVAEMVWLPVEVSDRGRPVRNLTAADFEILDNGVRQSVTAAPLETLALDVTLMVDVSGSIDEAALARARADIGAIAETLESTDRVRVIGFADRVADLTGWQAGAQRATMREAPRGGGTSLYDATAAALLATAGEGRPHLVVLFSDGRDTTSLLDLAAVESLAMQGLSTVYVSLTRSQPVLRGALPWSGQPDLRRLRTLASRTGGAVLELGARERAEAFREILRGYRTMYLLRYTPTGVTPGGWHAITVRVPGTRYTIRTRAGYGEGTGNR